MNEISRFCGITVSMGFDEGCPFSKPHVYAQYEQYHIYMAVDGELLDGSFPRKQFLLLQGWAALREYELYDHWNQAVRGLPLAPIEPLR